MKNYIDASVNAAAVNAYLDKHTKRYQHSLHTLQIYHGSKKILRYAVDPYRCDDKREIYSLSKSFCSTAIGLLIDDGKLTYETRIADIFPEYLASAASPEYMKMMTLSHVMSMNSGFACCIFKQLTGESDPVRRFFELPIRYQPGTHFTYNTGNTFLLSAVVRKYTGMSVLDFLDARIFRYLGIRGIRWSTPANGVNEGGTGIHVSSDDIVRFGRLYLNDGVYNGKRLISHDWIAHASSAVSDNSSNGTSDWASGYGYQFWINAHEGYRGDGATGQLCLILPKTGYVIAVQAEDSDMQAEVDDIYEMLAHLGEPSGEKLRDRSYSMETALPKASPWDGERYRFDANAGSLTQFSLTRQGKNLEFQYSDGANQYRIVAGNGRWIRGNAFSGAHMTPKLSIMDDTAPENNLGAACWYENDGKVCVEIRMTTTPRTLIFSFAMQGDDCTVSRWSSLDNSVVTLTAHRAKF